MIFLVFIFPKFSFGCLSCSKLCLSPPSPYYYTPPKYYEPKYDKYYEPKYYDKKEEKYYEAPKPYAASQTIATEPPKSDILPMLNSVESVGGVSNITPKTAIDYMDELAIIDNYKEKSTSSESVEKIHGNMRLEEQALEKMNANEDLGIEELQNVTPLIELVTEQVRPIRNDPPMMLALPKMPNLSEYDTIMAEEEEDMTTAVKKEPTGYTVSYKASY
ncbi:unnamed protein product [Caenorhabditis angaria]|uniref:Uncharacterized protein n=1 Tax=Caenorhabditis angaria TaxID=860376 RepID=A0A9P1MUJ2_9PELO|nr:unnamed protein product [Caenorhabditis angaria]